MPKSRFHFVEVIKAAAQAYFILSPKTFQDLTLEKSMFTIGESTGRVITVQVNLEWFNPILEKDNQDWAWQLVGQFN